MKRSEMDKLRMFVSMWSHSKEERDIPEYQSGINIGCKACCAALNNLLDTMSVDQEDVVEVPLSEESRRAVEAGLKDIAEGRTSVVEEDFRKYVEDE